LNTRNGILTSYSFFSFDNVIEGDISFTSAFAVCNDNNLMKLELDDDAVVFLGRARERKKGEKG
jgi:hypothetical protein